MSTKMIKLQSNLIELLDLGLDLFPGRVDAILLELECLHHSKVNGIDNAH